MWQVTSPQINARKQLAVHLAMEAGALLLRSHNNLRSLQVKSSPTDIATATDFESEALIVDGIKRQFPDDGIFAEEGSSTEGTSGFTWIIDPLDGTANFVRTLRTSAVSIALAQDDLVVLGVIFDPYANEVFTGITGGGVFLNDQELRPLELESTPSLRESFVGLSGSNRPEPQAVRTQLFTKFSAAADSVRDIGSTALSLCWTAAGRFNAHIGVDVAWWDIAAGIVICREAGCVAAGLNGEPDPSPEGFYVCQPQLKDEVSSLLNN